MFRKKPQPTALSPEWLVVGLGNPGPEYRGTRHNVGFDLVDLLCERYRIKMDRSKHRARFGVGQVAGVQVAVAKPLTYMNLSGQAVAPMMRDFGLHPSRILVVADDLDLPCGRTRLRVRGSAGGHNGHKSLINSLGTQEYPRLKIGIGRPEESTIHHVLGGFDPMERALVNEALDRSIRGLAILLIEGTERAMQFLNEGS